MKDPIKDVEKVSWMPCPKVNTEYPGLAYLIPLNELIVAKKIDSLHRVIGRNYICYTIFNNEGQKVFLAVQKRQCFRKFHMQIFNFYGNEVIHITKPCRNKVRVWAPPGNFVGFVEQSWRCGSNFLVKNEHGATILQVKAQSVCRDAYAVLSGGELVGQIQSRWHVKPGGADSFHVAFPLETDAGGKAVLLGASFLIGYLKF